MNTFFVPLLIAICSLLTFAHASHLPQPSVSLTNPFNKKFSFDKNQFKADFDEFVKDLPNMAKRFPTAVTETVKASAKAFSSSATILVPIGLMMNVGLIRQPKMWLLKGGQTGVEWAKIGVYYSGSEIFLEKLRGKNDCYNKYLGSGIASALLRTKEGPRGVIQGFCMGYAFMFAIDQFIGHDVPHHSVPSADTFHHHCVHAAQEANLVNKGIMPPKHH